MKGTWRQAILTFLAPLMGIFVFRWLLLEPFVIPSGSMIPTLLIHDHIFVNKLAYGIHWPFLDKWLIKWGHPQRREIAVFRFPGNEDIFYVKRIVAIGGDEIEVQKGQLYINGEPLAQTPMTFTLSEEDESFDYFAESGATIRYRTGQKGLSESRKIRVPMGAFFVMGDNRDQSSDSRVWGFVPESHLVGRAWLTWLSCDKTLQSAPFLCDPQSMRWTRIFHRVQ